jgi:hypothetical protein
MILLAAFIDLRFFLGSKLDTGTTAGAKMEVSSSRLEGVDVIG